MAGNSNRLVVKDLDSSWIADDPFVRSSTYAFLETIENPFVDVDSHGDKYWEVSIIVVSNQICS